MLVRPLLDRTIELLVSPSWMPSNWELRVVGGGGEGEILQDPNARERKSNSHGRFRR